MRLMVDLIHLYIKNITKNKTITLFSSNGNGLCIQAKFIIKRLPTSV